jgi:hypothetical protein
LHLTPVSATLLELFTLCVAVRIPIKISIAPIIFAVFGAKFKIMYARIVVPIGSPIIGMDTTDAERCPNAHLKDE